ncbi:DUF1254 domain-containing protein [Nocardia sp. 2]|uniref:DUF1254 domain-containing protein n=2 Tax=Nocardia acididurans TaxID=2802282 RepID=A0ABS1MI41_9NOCA|nr:DUF1254 domain-containing protein [Nocardia acididurans]
MVVAKRDDDSSKPSSGSGTEIDKSLIAARAFEAMVWGMPAVNTDRMLQAAIGIGGGANTIVYWSRLVDWHNQTLTPNPNAIYLMPFYDTTAGPMVLDIPPAEGDSTITGSIDTVWQTPLADVGPAGTDQGRGGRYLILPPGYNAPIPDGFIALASETTTGFALLRSNLKSGSDADIAAAVAYGKRVGLYRLDVAANPPPTTFVDAAGKDFDATIPYSREFYTYLDRVIQAEPWLPRDMAMIDQLASIGIKKGTAYQPDSQITAQLDTATARAHTWIEQQYVQQFAAAYYDNSQWAIPAHQDLITAMSNGYADPASYPVDARGVAYSFAFFAAKTLGSGQFYLMTITDKDGHDLDGGKTYHLTVPAHAPVSLYWSATAYNRATHTLIRDTDWPSRASNTPDLRLNADGSADIYFGPTAPDGKKTNWIPTKTGQQFEVLFRFYGPQPPLFDKTWKLPDIQRA